MRIFSAAFSSNSSVPERIKSGDWIPSSVLGMLGRQSSAGVTVSEQTAMMNSAVFACQRAIAESLAILPRDIYRRKARDSRAEVDDHPSLKVLKTQVNPLQTAYKFFETVQHHVLSYGNGYAELQFERGTGRVVAMWPLPPTKVRPEVVEVKDSLDIVYHVSLSGGSQVTLPKERVLHVSGLGFNGLIGYPVIQYMVNAIGLGQAVEEYGSKFFGQGADIAGYVSVPDTFTEEQIINLRKHNEIRNAGLDNAHRWKYLYESAKFVQSGATPEQAQMLDLRRFQVQDIARWYRIPLHKIQELSHRPSHNNLEQLNVEFVNDTLMPWITNWEQELERKVFIDPEDEGAYVKFNANALMRGDAQTRALFYRTMVMSGIMTRNEARALEDLPPIPGGDEPMLPLNMTNSHSDKELDANERIQD